MTDEENKILDSINQSVSDFITDLVHRADDLGVDRNDFIGRATSTAAYMSKVASFRNFIGS